MSRLSIPTSTIARILVRVRSMIPDLKRPMNEGERRMVEWLEKMTNEGDGDDMDSLVRKVCLLRSGWDRAMTALEQHTLHGSSECLNDFSESEWELMRDYLAYQPRAGEKFYQVRSRERFLQSPVDTLTAAQDWERTHRRKAAASRPARQQEPQRGEFSMDQFKEIFGSLRSGSEIEQPETPKPIPEPPETRTSLFE